MPEESSEVTAEQLLAAATQYDAAVEAGEEPSVVIEPPEEDAIPPVEENNEEEAEAPPELEADNTDNEESSLTEAETPEPEQKPKSKYAKNRERLNKTWAEANEVKEQNKREKEEIAREKAEIETLRTKLQSGSDYRDEHGHTAKDYEEAAENFTTEGDADLAKAAKAKAGELESKGKEVQTERLRTQAQQEWNAGREQLYKEIPDLRDDSHPLTIAANEVIKSHPDLLYAPRAEGLRHAVKAAQDKLEAQQVTKVKAENKELSDKLNELEKKTSITGGYSNGKPDGEKAFDDMSDDEQKQSLLRAAMAHDDNL